MQRCQPHQAARAVVVLSLISASMCAAPAAQPSAAAGWAAPTFYKGLQGPRFTVLKQLPGGIELRRYEPSTWATTRAAAPDKGAAMRGSFMKLFNYISGANKGSAKIAMTVPVLTRIEPGTGPTCDSTFTVGFFLQPAGASTSAAPPAPSDAAVSVTSLPALEVWVLPFGGFADATSERAKAAELLAKLKAAGEPVAAGGTWFTAGYNSPYDLDNRHNEVWLPRGGSATGGAGGATAAEAGAKPAAAGGAKKAASG